MALEEREAFGDVTRRSAAQPSGASVRGILTPRQRSSAHSFHNRTNRQNLHSAAPVRRAAVPLLLFANICSRFNRKNAAAVFNGAVRSSYTTTEKTSD